MQDAPLKEATKGTQADRAKYWLDQVKRARNLEKSWRDRSHKIIARYRDEQERDDFRMNILWANTETLQAALMPRVPQPDVRRRQSMQDAVGRAASMVLERAIEYQSDQYDLAAEMRDILQDALLPGRGVIRIRYKPELGPVPIIVQGQMMGEIEDVTDQRFCFEHVHWEDFCVGAARRWSEVPWIGFRHMMDRDQVKEYFGTEVANEVSYGKQPLGSTTEHSHARDDQRDMLAEVWEIWDKRNKQRVYVAEGYERLLSKPEDDPYELKHFFPVPRPLQFITTSENMRPIPEFAVYQDQIDELDIITGRIAKLTEALQRRGIYDASLEGLKRLADADDNDFVPVDNFMAYMEKGGLDSVFAEQRLDTIILALQQLYAAREQVLGVIYELTGISDIMRGETRDRETATTSRNKAFFGSLRIVNRKRELARFIRDAYRIMAEMIAEMSDPEILLAQTQVPGLNEENFEPVFNLLRDERDRGYRVDVETDETVAYDEEQDKRSRMETFQAVGNFIQLAAPLVQSGALDPEAAKGMVSFAMRPFKESREIEEQLQMLQPPQQQADPAKEMENALAQAEIQVGQMQQQTQAVKMQMQMQIDGLKLQLQEKDLLLKQMQLEQQFGVKVGELQLKAQDLDLKERVAEDNRERWEADLTTRIATANIQGETSRDVARINQGGGDGAV